VEVDRYTKLVLTIIAVGLWALVIKGVIAPQPVVAAEPTEEVQQLTRYDVRSAVKDCLDGALILSAGRAFPRITVAPPCR
jgi:hypothetical protein